MFVEYKIDSFGLYERRCLVMDKLMGKRWKGKVIYVRIVVGFEVSGNDDEFIGCEM